MTNENLKPGEHLTERNQKLPHRAFADTNLLQREYHNRSNHTVRFTRQTSADIYILKARKNLGPLVAEVKPGEFIYLPHGYYVVEGVGLPKGEPIEMLMNLEKSMFQGNKIPSNVYGLDE